MLHGRRCARLADRRVADVPSWRAMNVMSEELLSQEQARQLRMMMHTCLDQLAGNAVFIDEEDRPSACRLVPIGDCLVVTEFAPDPAQSRFRHSISSWSMVGGQSFKLGLRNRLAGTAVWARDGVAAGRIAAGDGAAFAAAKLRRLWAQSSISRRSPGI